MLTGSANLLGMRRVQESLAGRASYVSVWPLSRRERLGLGTAGHWDVFRHQPLARWRDALAALPTFPDDWARP